MSDEVDFNKLIFTDEQAMEIKEYDRTVELVGIAGDLDSGIPNLFKFTLRQQDGYHKVYCLPERAGECQKPSSLKMN